MAHGHTKLDEADKQPIGAKLWPAFRILGAASLVGLVLLVIGMIMEGADWQRRFFFAYLIGYCFVVALTVGSVALVILTHLFRAGWVVAVRRVPETFAANFWFVGLLGLPLLLAVFDTTAPLYPWSIQMSSDDPEVVTAETELRDAEHFVHDYLHGGHHDEDAGHADAGDPGEKEGEHKDAEGKENHGKPGDGHVTKSPAYEEAKANIERKAGDAYPEDREQAREVQSKFYDTLLYYMLDYKRFGGHLAGDAQVPIGKGWHWFAPYNFALRLIVYFAILSLMGWFYWTKSIKQDETGDTDLTTQREWWAPLSTFVFALTTTFLAFDLLMSLDPAWYSTMFGVIFFANSFTAGIAGTILVCMVLQKKGYLKTVTVEHYHDLGKLLFAFVFFWGYVSFSQFMLIWYASLPETTYWFELHGMTTVKSAPQYGSGWTYISLLILFGHLLVPFAFLLSRHVKRNLTALACAATWMLLMVYLDFYWYAMPFFESPGVTFGLPEIGAVLMLLSLVLAKFVRRYARHAPLAHGDPRLHESTALDTNVWAPIHH